MPKLKEITLILDSYILYYTRYNIVYDELRNRFKI